MLFVDQSALRPFKEVLVSISDDHLANILGDSNGPALRKTEERTGPPLEYVGEKLEAALVASHEVLESMLQYLPDELPQPAGPGSALPTKRDALLSPAWLAFRYGLVSYLALYNMLNLANVPGLPERLAAMSPPKFRQWLDNVTSEGSVTGR